MTCTCACHEAEENHEPDNCYCMRIPEGVVPKCAKCGIELDFETQLCESCLQNEVSEYLQVK